MLPRVLWATLLVASRVRAYTVNVSLPAVIADSTRAVYSNFMGISFELAYIDSYFGDNATSIPASVSAYLRHYIPAEGRPLRLRIGGNSMDDSVFIPTQQEMILRTGVNASSDDQPSTFGPSIFDLFNTVNTTLGGVQWILGLSLRDPLSPNITTLAAYAGHALGDTLDSLLLGNEPDLYHDHFNRPNLANYTTEDYFEDFSNVTTVLENSAQGNLLSSPILGGPSICCNWDLDTLIDEGYTTLFGSTLKYISLQHYPQNNCNYTNSSALLGLDYYLYHSNVVSLASWQLSGINAALSSNTSSTTPKYVTMTEFNSASCGGIVGISDTFAAAIWAVDYALQLSTVGYSSVYMHTREWNVSYSILWQASDGSVFPRPVYFSLLPVAAALNTTSSPHDRPSSGSQVVDLNVDGSMQSNSTMVAGYGIYDLPLSASLPSPQRLVLINYSNSTYTFSLPPSIFPPVSSPKGFPPPSLSLRLMQLTAPSTESTGDVTWNGMSIDTNGAWSKGAHDVKLCPKYASEGCSVDVATGVGVVFIETGGSIRTKIGTTWILSILLSAWTFTALTLL